MPASLLGMCAAAHHRRGGGRLDPLRPAPAVVRDLARAARPACTSPSSLGLLHQFVEGTTFTVLRRWPPSTGGRCGRWSLIALIVGRVVVPLWRNAHHQFRVAAVVPESDNVVSVHVTGRHLDRLPARAGPVLHLAVPRPQPLVAGQPVLAVGGARRPLAAADREGRRHDQRRAARRPGRHPGVRRGPVRRVHRAPPDQGRHAAHRRRRRRHADPRAARGVDRPGGRALPGPHHGRRRAARASCRTWRRPAARSCTC